MLSQDYVSLNGLRFHTVTSGSRNKAGKVMIFLHGFPEFWYEWKKQLEYFGREHFAVAYDQRGYNLSDKPAMVEDYTAALIVSDIKAMFEHFGVDGKETTGILVAHDWGGAVAWAFAIKFPGYLEKLIIINAPHPGVFARELLNNPAQQKASAYMNFFRSSQAEEVLAANEFAGLQKAIFGGTSAPANFSEEDRQAYLAAWSQPGALTGGLNWYRAARLGPPHPDLGSPVQASPEALKVEVPTLVIWGEQDTALLTGNLEGLEEYVPDLEITRIPEGTHWVIHEEPDLINRLIDEFIS